MEDVSDDFTKDLKGVNFQVALEIFKQQDIIVQGKKENFDLYLIERLFPVLLEGLERLSREVEAHSEKSGEVRERFNPCIFLGQYLMRNNPVHNAEKKQQVQYKQIDEYVRFEKFKRYFETKKASVMKIFMDTIKIDEIICNQQQMKDFFKAIDAKLGLNSHLLEFAVANRVLQKLKNNISFDNILTELTKYCSQHPTLTIQAFEAIL